jgi:exodeoxyribonuclease-3
MRIVSWNVNGLRACAKKGFLDFLDRCDADVVALQETRAFEDQLEEGVAKPDGWYTYFHPAERPGYSGVAIYSRQEPTRVETSLGIKELDTEGRYLCVTYGRLAIASVYFPNGSGKDRDNSRVPYKLDFYRKVFSKMQHKRKSGPVYIAGDYNTAHHEIDLARPKTNKKASGFLLEERDELSRWEEAGWVDTFRKSHQEEEGHYSWWRQFGGARESNVGWRIDYVFASPSAANKVRKAFIWAGEMGSDHCPVGVDLD